MRIVRLRGEGPSAPGRTLLGSGEEAVRLRGENVLVKSLIINLLKNGFFLFFILLLW